MSTSDSQASFDVLIGAPGAKQTLDESAAGLRAVGTAAVESATGIDRNAASTQRLIDVNEQMGRQQAEGRAEYDQSRAALRALEQQIATLSQSTQNLNGVSATGIDLLSASARGLREKATSLGLATDQLVQLTAAEDALVAAQTTSVGSTSRVTDASRAMTLAQIEAIAMNEKMATSNAAAGLSFDLSGAGLGRVRQGLLSLVARSTGTLPVIDRLGASLLGAFGVGQVVMIGVLAGVAALSFAWKQLESDADKFAERVAAAMKKVKDETFAAQMAMGDLQVGAARSAVTAAQDALAKVSAGSSRYNATLGGYSQDGPVNADEVARAKRNLLQAQTDLEQWQARKSQIDYATKAESDQAYADQLASLIKSGHATEDERARAIALYKRDIAEIEALGKSQTDNVRRLALITQAESLDAAMNPKTHVERVSVGPIDTIEQQKVLDGLAKQIAAMQKVNELDNVELAKSAEKNALLHTEGEARELLADHLDHQAQRLVAQHDYEGVALSDRLAAIDADERQNATTIRQATAMKDTADAMRWLNDQTKAIAKTGADNEKAIRDQADQYTNLSKILGGDLLHALDQATRGGSVSWTSMFRAAEAGSAHLLRQLSADLDGMAKKQAEARKAEAAARSQADKDHAAREAAKYASDSERYAEYLKRIQLMGAGLAGASIGFSVGQQSGSTTTGILGGAVGGAAAGFELGGPWGAVIGGFTGVIGGLMGAADAHRKAAEALQKAVESVRINLAQANASVGTGTALDATQLQITAQYKALKDAIDAAEPGLKAQVQREKDLAQATIDENLAQRQAIEADRKARADALESAQERILRAEGLTREADALALQLKYTNEVAAATKQFGANSDQVTAILAAQTAEAKALADAQAEASRQVDVSLKTRQLYAAGLKDEGDALARQEAERKEIDAAVKAGWTADQIAALKLTQAMEDQKTASDAAKAAAERYTVSMASLATQFLTLTGQVNAAAKATLAEQQRVATNAAVAAGAKPDELALLGLVQLFQRGQLEAQQQIKAQTDVLNAQLKTAQSALTIAQSTLQAFQQAANSLNTLRDGLTTGALSPLSPLDQLHAAKAQVDALYAKAQGGDATAAGQFGGAANSYLQLAKSDYASTSAYVDIFNTVSGMTDTLASQYSKQASLQQQTVDALNAQIALMQDELAKLQDANTLARLTKDAVIGELERSRDAALAPNGALIDQFNTLRDTLSGVGREIVTGERDILVGNQNDLTRVTQQEIDAINHGASAQELATLDAVRQLDLQKTAQDDYYARQLTETAKIYGYDSPQVREVVRLQGIYDNGVARQIDAIHGIHLVLPPNYFDPGQPGAPTPTPIMPYQPIQPLVPPGAQSFYVDPLTGATQFGVPGFASGGDFAGGARVVGEHGPELEVTGPSHIVSNNDLSSMLSGGGNQGLVTEIRALRTEVGALRTEVTGLRQDNSSEQKAIVRQQGTGFTGIIDAIGSVNKSVKSQETELRRQRYTADNHR
ncbi:MAG: hypothetical protein JWM41_2169 [Gemmatimonadetes bacterium]|nr:hypothetical protein [Gemmatimonadota bacterium]